MWQTGRTVYEVGKGTSSGCRGVVVVGEGSEEALREKGVWRTVIQRGQRRRFTR